MILLPLLPLLLAPAQDSGPVPPPPSRVLERANQRPNILLIVGDDMGVDLVSAYGEAPNPPCTTNLDALAAGGLLFRNAWANPRCAPTRAALMTGRYGFRTGIGGSPGLDLAETILPEQLLGYANSALGKWHLGSNQQWPTHPLDSGFAHFSGSRANINDYFDWTKTVDGQSFPETGYATTVTTDDAIAAVLTLPQPWFVYVAYNAPHGPTHAPPGALCGCPVPTSCDAPQNNTEQVKAMVEALDTEIGRLLTVVDAVDPDTLVVFLGDNGTGNAGSEPPFDSSKNKGTLYEGGVNVPLIVRGTGVVTGESDALVGATDLFATFSELAGVSSQAEDSVSLVPYFQGQTGSIRSHVYAELFSPGGQGPYTSHTRAVRNGRYKLIRAIGADDELYDLLTDPFEDDDLFPTLVDPSPEWDAYQDLVAELVDLGVD